MDCGVNFRVAYFITFCQAKINVLGGASKDGQQVRLLGSRLAADVHQKEGHGGPGLAEEGLQQGGIACRHLLAYLRKSIPRGIQ